MTLVLALVSGLLFGLGLIVSGMANPAKVQGFLDLGGNWDPSLAFVMGGGIAVASIAFALARRRGHAWNGDKIDLPANRTIDTRLIVGGLLFGTGWGIAGLCPGPALVGMSAGIGLIVLFVLAMLAGMWVHDRYMDKWFG